MTRAEIVTLLRLHRRGDVSALRQQASKIRVVDVSALLRRTDALMARNACKQARQTFALASDALAMYQHVHPGAPPRSIHKLRNKVIGGLNYRCAR